MPLSIFFVWRPLLNRHLSWSHSTPNGVRRPLVHCTRHADTSTDDGRKRPLPTTATTPRNTTVTSKPLTWTKFDSGSAVTVGYQRCRALSLIPSILHLSHGFQCSPTLNRQPYEGRLPLTSWWRKSSNMTVGQSSLISLAHHCYDWHPGNRCG